MDTCAIKLNSDSKQSNGIYHISLKGQIGEKTSDDIPETNNSNKYTVNEDPRIFEPPDKKKARWRSIRIMYLTMFLSSVTFTITMASLWPYLELVDRKASADFFGWIVAGYSLGQLVASPLFGFWSNRFNTTRWPLLLSIGINIVANIMYAYIESFPDTRQYYLLLARALVGFGAGNVAVVRSYVAGATTNEERTGVMANVSIFQSVGFILGPAFQAALVPLGYPGPVSELEFHLDLYTAPAFLSAVAGFINILLLVTLFKETRVTELTTLSIQGGDSESMNINTENKPDYFAVICSIMIFFVVLFIFTIFETIGSPLTMDMYGWSKKKATLYQGIILVGAGCEAIVVSLLLKRIAKR
ncbi:major facilitator superfamily domain-containing protein 8 isoform X2 [Patella vulgata]|uniref:major facilitator superfamily domain-containing protein 8 isoform X2 n=1 Tax=Patella vulgata TaxID=6465 RepID=UPI00217F6DCE|nr:major facilitator superfamily domain-containing protein 8 isoform X2 [Patella vulgata]